MDPIEFVNAEFYNNTVAEWIIALAISLILFLAFYLIKQRGLMSLRHLLVRQNGSWRAAVFETLQSTKSLVLFLLAFYIGLRGLSLPAQMEINFRILASAALFIQAGLWFTHILNAWSARYRERQMKANPGAVTTLGAVKLILHGLIWVSVVILILDNAGFDITALIAGLGIGGVAVALAIQNILGDLFSSLSIVLDKTFAVGDFIIVGEYMGTVENIGMKTTRIRSLSGEQIVFSNSDLLKGRIRNYGRMYERRVCIKIGVVYETPREKLKKIPAVIRQAIESQNNTRFDRAHFLSYGSFSLDFEYVYYVLSADYNQYMDINQSINFCIHEKFEEEDIAFAYLTQTLFIESSQAEWQKDRKVA